MRILCNYMQISEKEWNLKIRDGKSNSQREDEEC
jgi:hypothetical protein